ncbi:MAG: repeat-containing protein [Chitinophagaceae bacterium]|nr:repeat-containing protein [Chitinophagaceae bacterium]
MKIKFLFSLALFAFLSCAVTAQTYLTQVKPAGNKSWGYANSKGELVIPAQYAKCYKFSSEGLAPIYDTEKRQYYFINTKGETLTTEISGFKLMDGFGADLSGFNSGLAPVKIGEKWGYMNAQGKLAIQAKYDKVSDFNEGYATAISGGKHLVLDTKGTEIPVPAEVVELKEFSGKYAPFRAADKKFGFVGTDGKVAVPAQYESVGYFSGGLAWAKDAERKLGYINSKGEWVIKPQFTGGKEFDSESGFARIKEGEQWAYVSKTGEILRVTDTQTYGDFCNGLAEGKKDEKVGFFNTKGVWVIAPQFEGVRDFKNGFAAAKLNGKWGFIDTKGNWVVQPQFDGIKDLELIK